MKERIVTTNEEQQVLVQYNKNHMMVGIGIEPDNITPSRHMVDQIYGDVQTQTVIGDLLHKRFNELRLGPIDFPDSDSEAEYHNQLGRCVLDAVTGSKQVDGWWTWLERASVNRLIRLLRKARDDAFGRDE